MQESLKRRNRVPGSSLMKEKDGSTTSSGAADPPGEVDEAEAEGRRGAAARGLRDLAGHAEEPLHGFCKEGGECARECASARKEIAAMGRRRELIGSRIDGSGGGGGRIDGFEEAKWRGVE